MNAPRRKLIAGNWKMNTTRAEALALASACASINAEAVDILICPPFPWLAPVAAAISGRQVQLGAQDCWPKPSGAYTGAVSVTMLQELVTHVIVGHSERRQIFGERDDLVRDKLNAVLAVGLTPILCVGEALGIREQGKAEAFVRAQLASALSDRTPEQLSVCVIAYEPIWAIGTGRAASASDAESMAAMIRVFVNELHQGIGPTVRILYGGSVNAANAAETLWQPNVDGALVGGASLNADAFGAIVAAANH